MPARLNLLSPEVRRDPYPHYAALRRDAPVCQIDPGGLWAVTRHDDVAFVLKRYDCFSSAGFRPIIEAPWLDDNPLVESMMLMDPPEHTRLRALVSHAFNRRSVARLEGLLRRTAARLVDAMRERGEGELYADLANPLPAAAIAEMLGLDLARSAHFIRWSRDLNQISVAGQDAALVASTRATVTEMQAYLREVIDSRRRAPRDDLPTELLAAEVDGKRLSEREVVCFLILLLLGGFETTSHLIAGAVATLLDHPDVLARVRADPALIPALIEEVLRYAPSSQALARMAVRDVELSGVTVPAGAITLPIMASANRDEKHFANPERFDIDRRRPNHLTLGHGAHHCLGATLGRLEARIALEALFSSFQAFVPRAPAIEWTGTIFTRHPQKLLLTYVPA